MRKVKCLLHSQTLSHYDTKDLYQNPCPANPLEYLVQSWSFISSWGNPRYHLTQPFTPKRKLRHRNEEDISSRAYNTPKARLRLKPRTPDTCSKTHKHGSVQKLQGILEHERNHQVSHTPANHPWILRGWAASLGKMLLFFLPQISASLKQSHWVPTGYSQAARILAAPKEAILVRLPQGQPIYLRI